MTTTQHIVQARYSTKIFDPDKKIDEANMTQVKNLLRMAPSSTNMQPWHFVIASTPEGKKRIAKGTQGFYQFNESRVLDASHVIVLCAKTDISKAYIQQISEQEAQDGRYASKASQEKSMAVKEIFVNMHHYDLKDLQHWTEKQVYLNMGFCLMGLAQMGIDALAIEGADFKIIDEELKLREQGLSAALLLSIGYRHTSDFNTPNKLRKSRLAAQHIFSEI